MRTARAIILHIQDITEPAALAVCTCEKVIIFLSPVKIDSIRYFVSVAQFIQFQRTCTRLNEIWFNKTWHSLWLRINNNSLIAEKGENETRIIWWCNGLSLVAFKVANSVWMQFSLWKSIIRIQHLTVCHVERCWNVFYSCRLQQNAARPLFFRWYCNILQQYAEFFCVHFHVHPFFFIAKRTDHISFWRE